MSGILEGVKVVEMGHVVAIPAAAAMMGDCGAEVIKIEPLTGDQSRRFRGTETNPGFYLHNRSTKSIAIDLRQQAGKDIVNKLVKDYDIFMTNYQAASLEKLKMDYETLSKINPGLIYGIVSAYGTVGPYKDAPGYDFAAGWARSGIQNMIMIPGIPPPSSRPGIIDRVSSLQIFGGIAAALYHKEKTGKGQKVEFNLYHTGVWMVGADIMDALVGVPLHRIDPRNPENPLYETYRTKDDKWLQLTAGDRYAPAADPEGRVFWAAFCRALDRPALVNDPRFATTVDRQKNRQELTPILNQIFTTRTYDDWEKRLKENNLMFGPIQSPEDVIKDPQALANDFFVEIDQPEMGRMKMINMPIKFVEDPAVIRSPAPLLGEHTEEVLRGLNYSADAIAQLRKDKVVL